MANHPSETFEVSGYFIEYQDVETNQYYGYEVLSEQGDWTLGYWGSRIEVITVPKILTNGLRDKLIKACKAKPVTVRKTMQAICGRALISPHTYSYNNHEDQERT